MHEEADDFREALDGVAAGAWAVGVSGGADSVALLLLLRRYRPEVRLHVVHLDHETRQGQSADDARFVGELAEWLKLACTVRRRSEIELVGPPRNRSARFRAARLALFRRVVEAEGLCGVLLAHHADDQAETVLHRLLRGAGPGAVAGMRSDGRVGGVRIVRPLLGVRPQRLREVLRAAKQAWREDASNVSVEYQRNRLRQFLSGRPEVRDSLLELGRSCGAIGRWSAENAPRLGESFAMEALAGVAGPLGRRAAAHWLGERGVPRDRIDRGNCDRLIGMAADAASAARLTFAGGVVVRRRGGVIFAEPVSLPVSDLGSD